MQVMKGSFILKPTNVFMHPAIRTFPIKDLLTFVTIFSLKNVSTSFQLIFPLLRWAYNGTLLCPQALSCSWVIKTATQSLFKLLQDQIYHCILIVWNFLVKRQTTKWHKSLDWWFLAHIRSYSLALVLITTKKTKEQNWQWLVVFYRYSAVSKVH